MAGNFQDRFPLDPTQAVQASTFLTDQERAEWMQWLTSATPEDKAELVNTLHEIWIENNATAPKATAPVAPLAQVAPAPVPVAPVPAPSLPPAPIPAPIAPAPIPAPVPVVAPIPQALPPRPVQSAPTQPVSEPKVETPKYSFKTVDENVTPVLPPKSVPTQQRPSQDRRPDPRDQRDPRDNRPQRNDRNDQRPNQDRPERQDRPVQPGQSITQSNFVDLSKMQTEKTRSILDAFVKEFSQTRRSEEGALLKLKDAVLGVEEVTNYSDLLAEKILALNSAQVQATKVTTKTRDELLAKIEDIEIRTDDVQTMIERAQEEIDRMARRQRSFETDVKEMLSKINEQLSGINTDQFGGSDKLAIITRRLDRMEESKQVSAPQQAPSAQNQFNQRFEQRSNTQQNAQPQRNETPKPTRQQITEMKVEVPQMPSMSNDSTDNTSNFMPLKLGGRGDIK
jgi:hypothetical protein